MKGKREEKKDLKEEGIEGRKGERGRERGGKMKEKRTQQPLLN